MDLFVYGSGATGREVLDIISRHHQAGLGWSDVHFVDDITLEASVLGKKVFRFEAMLAHDRPYQCVIALGEPRIRQSLHHKLLTHGVALATVIDPQTTLSSSAVVEPGCIIGPGTFISCNTRVSENTLVEIKCIIGHDIHIGAHSVISSGTALGGHSRFGQSSFIGMNASVRDRVRVGDRSIIGMASAVFNDIPDDVIAVGNPARVVRKNEAHSVFK